MKGLERFEGFERFVGSKSKNIVSLHRILLAIKMKKFFTLVCFLLAMTVVVAQSNKTFTVEGFSFKMIYVEGGTFTMGCTSEQTGCENDEKPAHEVTVSNFYIGETEVTQLLWHLVMGTEPSAFGGWTDEFGVGSMNPAYRVSWDDCQQFCEKLNQMCRKQLPAGYHFALPTEAQWEYAARGGNKSKGFLYSGSNNLDDVAWYWQNSGDNTLSGADSDWNWDKIQENHGKTHPVKRKAPNELGLYDMSGNVWEWCADIYDAQYYEFTTDNDPLWNPSFGGTNRVNRGGSWINYASRSRVSDRETDSAETRDGNLGLRLVLVK